MKKEIPFYQVDAFADGLFTGNPAAVCILDEWLPEAVMQKIGMENNLSETAFVVKKGRDYEIRWFTPLAEVELCGHATLATSFVLFSFYEKNEIILSFKSMKRGVLTVEKKDDLYILDFPADTLAPSAPPQNLIEAIGAVPLEIFRGRTDYLLVYKNAEEIMNIKPDFEQVKSSGARGVMVTAPGEDVDFVSRFFAPSVGINEDPVTGSAHTSLIPYWSKRTGKSRLTARQLSARGGRLWCELRNDRVRIGGKAVCYLVGKILIDV
ncbi:MAG: PhzF family phenazine biosynthesis protein [Bacteroidales bacterium]|nr:PhzF family phenazine biosynthesis protein [Bacteroidales bacterium]